MKMKLLRRQRAGLRPLCLTAFALLAAGTMAPAQTFTYANNDLILGLRKNSPYTENYEVVVDIGQASNYFNLTVGTDDSGAWLLSFTTEPGLVCQLEQFELVGFRLLCRVELSRLCQ